MAANQGPKKPANVKKPGRRKAKGGQQDVIDLINATANAGTGLAQAVSAGVTAFNHEIKQSASLVVVGVNNGVLQATIKGAGAFFAKWGATLSNDVLP